MWWCGSQRGEYLKSNAVDKSREVNTREGKWIWRARYELFRKETIYITSLSIGLNPAIVPSGSQLKAGVLFSLVNR